MKLLLLMLLMLMPMMCPRQAGKQASRQAGRQAAAGAACLQLLPSDPATGDGGVEGLVGGCKNCTAAGVVQEAARCRGNVG
jgi:hypothetical protein